VYRTTVSRVANGQITDRCLEFWRFAFQAIIRQHTPLSLQSMSYSVHRTGVLYNLVALATAASRLARRSPRRSRRAADTNFFLLIVGVARRAAAAAGV
jgi:hypothetical protein